MTNRSTYAADLRAANAALSRPLPVDPAHYLVLDDNDEDITQILTVIRERSPRTWEPQP
jgi:hypothetical protein